MRDDTVSLCRKKEKMIASLIAVADRRRRN